MSEIDDFRTVLNKFWRELRHEGDEEIEGFVTVARVEGYSGRWNQHIDVITRGPSGQHYRWSYGEGLTEYQKDTEPDTGRGITPVVQAVVNAEILDWIAGEGTVQPVLHTYVPFAEHLMYESEVWTSWIQLDGNEAELGRLGAYLDDCYRDSNGRDYSLNLSEGYLERDVHVLVEFGAQLQQPQHRRLVGRLELPADEELRSKNPFELFRRGGIDKFVKES